MGPFRKINLIAFLSFFLSIFQGTAAFSHPLPFMTMERGEISYFRYGDPDFSGAEFVIRDQKAWEWFWEAHTSGILPRPPLPGIDFLRETVLIALLGYQASGGGPGIEIQSVEALSPPGNAPFPGRDRRKAILVTVEENREAGALTVITNPYHIIKISQKFSSLLFQRQRAGRSCLDDTSCQEGEFCRKKAGQCGEEGMCLVRPDVCFEMYAPVCGCDGKTYENECAAASAGVSMYRKGVCKKECIESGGAVITGLCCPFITDFPNTCAIGACGCFAEYSEPIRLCDCGEGRCFNGNRCASFGN